LPLLSLLEHHHRRKRRHIAFVFFFSNTKKTKHTRKQQKKKPREVRELTFKFPFSPFTFGSHFCPLVFALLFQTLSPDIFLFSSRRKIKHKEKKTIEKKKYVEKGGSLPSSSHSTFSLLAPASTFLLLHLCFKCFILAFSSFQA